MLEPAQIITLKPVNKLLSTSGKTHITAKEYREMLAGLVKNPRSAPCYDKILAPLESELFLGRRRISKLELQQQLDARLRAAELNFRRVLHKPLYSENAYCAPGDVTQYYDLAYYNPAAPLVSGHAHNNQSQYSTFYMRFEDAPDHDNLLVGNLQTARLEKTSHPLWQRPNLKKLMVQMAIQEAQRTRRKYLTFHSGAALVIAQNWKKPPSKQAYYEKTVRQNPHAELITPDNIDYYRALHCRKIELLAQAPKPLKKEFYIARKEYEIIKKTSAGLQIKPAGLFAYTADPLGYLFELGAQQEHARNLAQTRPEITLSPGFENLPDLTSTCPWGEKIYTQLWDSYCNKNYHQFTDYFNEIIKKLLPGSAGVPAACSIKQLGALMDNFAEIGAVSGALMVHYLRHFNYLHLLMNKYCFLQEKFTGRPGQAALYQHNKPAEFAGLTLNSEQIVAPVLGEVYTTATDYFFATENYKELVAEIPTGGINPRYVLYNFYEKEIPKLLQQLGHNCIKVPLITTKCPAKDAPKYTSYGWQIVVPPPAPIVIF